MTDAPRTLAEKVWDRHVVRTGDGLPDLLYIDLHLVHEVTSPQAFDGLRLAGRPVRRPDLTVATEDEVEVDVEQVGGAVATGGHDVAVPDLLAQGLWRHAWLPDRVRLVA